MNETNVVKTVETIPHSPAPALLKLQTNGGDRIFLMSKWRDKIRALEVTAMALNGKVFFHLEHIDTVDARLILQDLCYSLKRAADMAWGRV
jgi:hypothetical protein